MGDESGAEGGGGSISLLVVLMRRKGLLEGEMVEGWQGGVLEGQEMALFGCHAN